MGGLFGLFVWLIRDCFRGLLRVVFGSSRCLNSLLGLFNNLDEIIRRLLGVDVLENELVQRVLLLRLVAPTLGHDALRELRLEVLHQVLLLLVGVVPVVGVECVCACGVGGRGGGGVCGGGGSGVPGILF